MKTIALLTVFAFSGLGLAQAEDSTAKAKPADKSAMSCENCPCCQGTAKTAKKAAKKEKRAAKRAAAKAATSPKPSPSAAQ